MVRSPLRRLSLALLLTMALAGIGGRPLAAKEASVPPPPGFNVHCVLRTPEGHVFWRGGAPRKDTIENLARSATARGVSVTLIDLRHPPSTDDLSGKGGRLTPQAEAALGAQKGFRYLSISALDRQFNQQLDDALSRGDVYLHCMYGVNRTGFSMGRYARKHRVQVSKDGLGSRDWSQGDAFEVRLEATRKSR